MKTLKLPPPKRLSVAERNRLAIANHIAIMQEDSHAQSKRPISGPERRAEASCDSFNLPPGMVAHKVRNVIRHGGAEYVCVKVNDCRAVFECMTTRRVEAKFIGKDEPVVFESAPRVIGISPAAEPENIIRVMTQEEFSERHSQRVENKQKNPAVESAVGQQEQDNMKKTEKKSAGKKVTWQERVVFIEKLAKAGKTQKQMTELVTKEYGKVNKGNAGDIVKLHGKYNGKPAVNTAPAKKGGKAPPAKKPAKTAPALKTRPGAVPPPPPKTSPPLPPPRHEAQAGE